MSILSNLALTAQEWEQLRPLLKENDLEISVLAAEIALDAAPRAEKVEAATLLIRSFADASAFQQIQIHECLERNYAIVRDRIVAEIRERRKKPPREQTADHVLRILLAVRLAHETSGKADVRRDAGSGQ